MTETDERNTEQKRKELEDKIQKYYDYKDDENISLTKLLVKLKGKKLSIDDCRNKISNFKKNMRAAEVKVSSLNTPDSIEKCLLMKRTYDTLMRMSSRTDREELSMKNLKTDIEKADYANAKSVFEKKKKVGMKILKKRMKKSKTHY